MNALKTNKDIKLDSDFTGARLLDTDVYPLTITAAYALKSKKGALMFTLTGTLESGKEFSTQTCVVSGKGKNTYTNKKTGDEAYLPGFVIANTLSLLAIGKEIGDVDTDDKVINIYNFEKKGDLPTTVQMFSELVGAEVLLAVEKQIVDKQAQNDQGDYVATGETREVNEVTKVFRARDSLTVTEITAEATEATYIHTWKAANEGTVKNKSKVNGTATGAPPAAGKTSAAAAGGVKSLFN